MTLVKAAAYKKPSFMAGRGLPLCGAQGPRRNHTVSDLYVPGHVRRLCVSLPSRELCREQNRRSSDVTMEVRQGPRDPVDE